MKIFRRNLKVPTAIVGVLAWMMILGWVTTQGIAETSGTSSDTVPGYETFGSVSVALSGKKVVTTHKSTVVLKGSIKPKTTTAKVFYTLKTIRGKHFQAAGSAKAWTITLQNLRLGKTRVYVFAALKNKASKAILIVVNRVK